MQHRQFLAHALQICLQVSERGGEGIQLLDFTGDAFVFAFGGLLLGLQGLDEAALFAAAPARAGGEFRDGFEDQLGRLVALEVFHVGHVLLTGGWDCPFCSPFAPPTFSGAETALATTELYNP